MEKVLVLLSTYNGEKYISEQLDSVLAQYGVSVSVLIRDDGSSDKTIEILKKYSGRYDNIEYFQGENIKSAQSFLQLISLAKDYPYYALCDQDDVWEKNKLLCAVNELQKMNNDVPLLYYSNLKVVDEKLDFIRLAHDKPHVQKNKYSSLVEPIMTGCTGVFNLTAKRYIERKIPEYCSMHDTWIYMICKVFGEVYYDFTPHILYRQHGNNVIGAYKKRDVSLYIERLRRLLDRNLQPRYKNAINFYECFSDVMDDTTLDKVNKIINYKNSALSMFRLLCDRDLCASSFSRDLRNKFLIIAKLL